jgi:hypothetical protein
MDVTYVVCCNKIGQLAAFLYGRRLHESQQEHANLSTRRHYGKDYLCDSSQEFFGEHSVLLLI